MCSQHGVLVVYSCSDQSAAAVRGEFDSVVAITTLTQRLRPLIERTGRGGFSGLGSEREPSLPFKGVVLAC